MEEFLKFTIEDKEIAMLFGRQNFSTEQSAVLEIVKNAYDAGAFYLQINIKNNFLEIIDDGEGMTKDTIKTKWMTVGKSEKKYSAIDRNGKTRVLSGSKGVGRFALARLGNEVTVITKEKNSLPCIWKTNWSINSVDDYNGNEIKEHGTIIRIASTNDYWDKKRAKSLRDYISICKNFDDMNVVITFCDESVTCDNPFKMLEIGHNYLTRVDIRYHSVRSVVSVVVTSDEFDEKAQELINKNFLGKDKLNDQRLDIHSYEKEIIVSPNLFGGLFSEELIKEVGSFEASFYYSSKYTEEDTQRFLYKNRSHKLEPFVAPIDGVTLYRNSFSIANYEKGNDWLELSKRAVRSPAAATHPSGRWRVRHNQICGTVLIDRNENSSIRDMQNRQGIENNDAFNCFKEIILLGIDCFEEYRQAIVRIIDKRNKAYEPKRSSTAIIDKFLRNPQKEYNSEKRLMLAGAIGDERTSFKSKEYAFKKKVDEYNFALSLLNSLATLGLKSSLFAHKIDNKRNIIQSFCNNIIRILKDEGIWNTLSSKEYDTLSDSIPYQMRIIESANLDLLNFVDTSLDAVKAKHLKISDISVKESVENVISDWKLLYGEKCPLFRIEGSDFTISLPFITIKTIFDNLILNSLQQNSLLNKLIITIEFSKEENGAIFTYSDNGIGLDSIYRENPMKILEPFVTNRGEDGHGLGMWIVNNFIESTKGKVIKIGTGPGFSFEFLLNNVEKV